MAIRPVLKPKVVKDPQWLKVVRGMKCHLWNHESIHRDGNDCMPWDTIGRGPSEASHLDTKSRDDRVLPMCGGHHRTLPTSWHNGQKSFCRHYGLTKAQLIAEAEALYQSYQESR